MKKIVVGLAVMLGFCTCAHQPSGTLDVNKALDYCAEQTQRTLAELKTDSGIDYTMMPRNIMTDEHHWNLSESDEGRMVCRFLVPEYCGMITNMKDKQIQEERRSSRTLWSSFPRLRL